MSLTKSTSWISRIDARLNNILRNNCAGSNHNVVADLDRHDGGVGAYGNPVSNAGTAPFSTVFTCWAATGEAVVYEHCAVRNKAVIADCDQFADKGVGLDPAAVADHNAFLDLDEWPDETIFPEGTIV